MSFQNAVLKSSCSYHDMSVQFLPIALHHHSLMNFTFYAFDGNFQLHPLIFFFPHVCIKIFRFVSAPVKAWKEWLVYTPCFLKNFPRTSGQQIVCTALPMILSVLSFGKVRTCTSVMSLNIDGSVLVLKMFLPSSPWIILTAGLDSN